MAPTLAKTSDGSGLPPAVPTPPPVTGDLQRMANI